MRKRLNLLGQKFGRLTVIKLDRMEQKYLKDGKKGGFCYYWLCKCDCGEIVSVAQGHLISGHTKSCSCYWKEKVMRSIVTHNLTYTRIYKVYEKIKSRCYNKNNIGYKDYGGRGIVICDKWKNDFQAFYDWAINNGYDENAKRGECTIDRINVNGNYEPDNCRWVNAKEQARNRRSNRLITYKGTTLCIMDWSKLFNISYYTLIKRFNSGWSAEKALSTPVRKVI